MRLLLIDGSNLYESAKALNLRIDYKRLLNLFNEDGNLLRAYYFTALPDRSVENWLFKQVDWMAHNGYSIVSKSMQKYIDAHGVEKKKGNVDVDITVYAWKHITRVNEIFLFSGDGDFSVMVKHIQENYAIKVRAISAQKLMNFELRKQVDQYIDLADIRDDIEKLPL